MDWRPVLKYTRGRLSFYPLQMSTYLSVDLDYWKRFPSAFMDKLVALRVPTWFVIDHHHVLPHMENLKYTRLINMDYHADITNHFDPALRAAHLTCGNWVNYTWKPGCEDFLWLHPHKPEDMHEGFCHYGGDLFTGEEKVSGWLVRRPRQGYPMPDELRDVIGISICWSPDYDTTQMRKSIVQFLCAHPQIKRARPPFDWPPGVMEHRNLPEYRALYRAVQNRERSLGKRKPKREGWEVGGTAQAGMVGPAIQAYA